jgi:hypothetical protein
MKITRQVVLALCMAAVILCSWLAPLDSPAAEQVDAGLKRALVSFATARALNGVISVVQGTEIVAQPLGVGVTLTPGQLLAPINELVKHFSDLMLAASVAFGIQKALIGIGGYWLVSLVLTAVAIGWTWFYFRQRHPPSWLSRILVILLMVRFAIPLITVGTEMLSQRFLAADYMASQHAIDLSSGQVAMLSSPVPTSAEAPGMLERIKDWFPKDGDLKTRFDNLKKSAEQVTEHIIKLMVIFLLQTLVIPLLLLWGLYGVARVAFELPRYTSDVPAKR